MAVPHIFAGTAGGTTSQLDANFSYFSNAIAVSSGVVTVIGSSSAPKLKIAGGGTASLAIPATVDSIVNSVRLEGDVAAPSVSALSYSSSGGGGAIVALGRDATYGTAILFGTNPSSNAVVGAVTERMRIDSDGNVISSAPASPPYLSTNGTMVMNLTSNTNLRISVRGSDGITRVANITLA